MPLIHSTSLLLSIPIFPSSTSNRSLKRMHFDRRYLKFRDFGIRLDGLFLLLRRLLKFLVKSWFITIENVICNNYLFIGIALPTPCPTRWNSLFDSLVAFLKNFKSLEIVNKLFSSLTLPLLTKEDLELLTEYMEVMKPLAVVLDILQGDKGVFLGIGLVLPLITRLKDLMNQRVYLHLGPIRDRVLEKVDKRYYNFKCFFYCYWYCVHSFF